ncbi:kinesin-like protein KIN-7F [Magnolia sinica]|uniref:kinesin-like protein KIN-7F n=1 Tax=Magnolia sinica TaxID=86752 RepID=UPI00265B2001|nr:kinesin-like protein KIN-7F [Magnolia sinica]XP_058109389.1 kinesin-like protein KIN-7F [Magnolia sinica]XP_058109396.1 kinesin-like protein KIN-7F [Magnolia sinica]
MGAIGGEELREWERMQEAAAAAAAANANRERILVSVRLRPLSDREVARNDVSDWECISDSTIIFRNSLAERSMSPTAYTFDRVFRSDSSTKQVYEEAAKEVALSVVSGINASIFAYGQTSSGKTYTMNGITEYTVADIYDYIQRHEERAFVLKFSAIEIYNEAVRDLLGTDGTPLRIRDDPERGPIVEKLTEEILRDWRHMQHLLSICESQRQVGETSLNEASSRSHQILRLTIESSAREFLGKDNSSTLSASVNFVDLAGSERASQALSGGARLKEGCHINRSLLTLGTVIRKLSKGRNGHIPYRDSKLTRILQPSLGGNARTAIICTLSPARSHIEQSRNTLLFATCAKEVVTSARVNVVMSDKALVKHLQKELARLESALRSPGPTSVTSHSQALLREKDAKIRKMEKEIKDLIQQRDHAQSRLEVLIRVVGEDQASRLWSEFSHPPASTALTACEDEVSVSESSGVVDQCLDFGWTKFNISQYSEEYSGTDCNEHYPQLSEIPEDQVRSGDTSPRLSVNSPRFIGRGPQQHGERIGHDSDDDLEDPCKEVRCIEMEESTTSRNGQPNALLAQGNERLLPWIVNGNVHSTGRELVPTANVPRELRHVDRSLTYGALDQQLQGEQRTISNLVRSYEDGSSPWPLAADLSSSRSLCLTKSRSCRASLMTSSSSARFQEAEQNEYTPPRLFDKDFPRNDGGFQRRPWALKYGTGVEMLSRQHSQNSECSSTTDVLKMQNAKTASDENITSIHSFVAGLKEMARLQHQKQLVDGQESEPKAHEDFGSERTSKDVGLDPMQNPMESPSCWPLEFERQRREIIELWHACNVSLVHRTYFFLLFKGDPADSIYMEVELRRLCFLRNSFSQGNLGKPVVEDGRVVTPASSMKTLRRERVMLSKKMQKSFSVEERSNLYNKWGIGLFTRWRRLQLANRLWTETADMDHITESAAIVAKAIGFIQPGQAFKEMFGLSFTPRRTSRRFHGWKHSVPYLL